MVSSSFTETLSGTETPAAIASAPTLKETVQEFVIEPGILSDSVPECSPDSLSCTSSVSDTVMVSSPGALSFFSGTSDVSRTTFPSFTLLPDPF